MSAAATVIPCCASTTSSGPSLTMPGLGRPAPGPTRSSGASPVSCRNERLPREWGCTEAAWRPFVDSRSAVRKGHAMIVAPEVFPRLEIAARTRPQPPLDRIPLMLRRAVATNGPEAVLPAPAETLVVDLRGGLT